MHIHVGSRASRARRGYRVRRRSLAAAVILAAVGLAASACSSGSSGAASSSSSDIVLGVMGGFQGVTASSGGPAKPAIEAWASAVNAAGGLNGHQVKLIIKEDAGVASTAMANVRKLIQQDHVVAIVNDWSTADDEWGSYAQQQGVPVVGGRDQVEFSTNPDFFPSGTSFVDLIAGFMQVGAKAGVKTIAVPYCSEIAACSQATGLIKQVGAPAGVTVVWSGSFSSSAPDYTAQCLAAKASGATAMSIAASSDADIKFAAACAQQGYDPLQLTSDSTITADWLKAPALNNTLATEEDAPWFLDTSPALQAFHAAMQKYQPAAAGSLNSSSIMAWASGQLFAAAYKAAGSPNNVTSAEIKQGLYALKGDTLGGIAPPLTFNKDKPNDIKCFFVIGIKDAKFVAPQGLTTSCTQ
jgi:branched-chain amino acid transport system substrate-binding protein